MIYCLLTDSNYNVSEENLLKQNGVNVIKVNLDNK